MVRLKGQSLAVPLLYLFVFQFHNGSIKRQCKLVRFAKLLLVSIPQWFDLKVTEDGLIDVDTLKFQFHNGSIKRTMVSTVILRLSLFQFHNGSIKSLKVACQANPYLSSFQFHNGSIKSITENKMSYQERGFNSTMVRLKVGVTATPQRTDQLFQFHNGSIKRKSISSLVGAGSLFQFHNGSIKRLANRRDRRVSRMFQFHNGSIKSVKVA